MIREKVIAILESYKSYEDNRTEDLLHHGYNNTKEAKKRKEALDIAIKALSVPEREKGEWIPVMERLPENNVRVLCSAISTSISGGYTRFVGCCNNGFWFVQTDAETVSYPRQYKVTAWTPLPEPYKADMRGGKE